MRRRKLILLVEDNELCGNLFQLILKDGFGCDVHWTKNGLEAVEIAADIVPDLIQMDIQLPEVSGWNCIRLMRKIGAIDAIPICVVTASGFYGKGDISDIRPGVQAEMEKAVSIPAYVAMVHTLLYGTGARISPTLTPRPQPLTWANRFQRSRDRLLPNRSAMSATRQKPTRTSNGGESDRLE